MSKRFREYVTARRRSASIRADIAKAGFYSTGADEDGDLRFNVGGRQFSVFDLMPSNPALSPRARIVHVPFQIATDVGSGVWDESNQNDGTVLTVQDAVGNKAKFTNDTGDNDYYYYEYVYEKAQLIAGKDVWYYTSIEIGDVDEADMFVGLCADLASGDLFDNRVDCVGLTLVDGSAVLNTICTKGGTGAAVASSKTLTLSDNTEYFIGFHSNGTSYVDFFAGVPGSEAHQGRIRTNLPDDQIMAPAFGLRNGTNAANTFTISDMWIIMDR